MKPDRVGRRACIFRTRGGTSSHYHAPSRGPLAAEAPASKVRRIALVFTTSPSPEMAGFASLPYHPFIVVAVTEYWATEMM
jgi:hypothetical protein